MNKRWTLIIGSKYFSSWSLRPWLALKEAGITFEEKTILVEDPEFKKNIEPYSPNKKVPVLITPDFKISESLAICEYAAEFFPDLWPKDQSRRALARAVSHEMHAGFYTLRSKMSMRFGSDNLNVTFNRELHDDIGRVQEIWTTCRSRYKTEGPYLFGAFSIADAMYAPVVSRFKSYGIDTNTLCRDYMDTMWNLPSMQEWLLGAKQEQNAILKAHSPQSNSK